MGFFLSRPQTVSKGNKKWLVLNIVVLFNCVGSVLLPPPFVGVTPHAERGRGGGGCKRTVVLLHTVAWIRHALCYVNAKYAIYNFIIFSLNEFFLVGSYN